MVYTRDHNLKKVLWLASTTTNVTRIFFTVHEILVRRYVSTWPILECTIRKLDRTLRNEFHLYELPKEWNVEGYLFDLCVTDHP